MKADIEVEPLSRAEFAPFGQVVETEGANQFPINGGMAERFHDLAQIELAGEEPRPLISIFRGRPYPLPHILDLLERHPLGSQAFIPLSGRPFLVIVAPDEEGVPGRPRAFITRPDQGVNISMNTWHGVLTPLEAVSEFLIVDRGGKGVNLEEFHLDQPYRIVLPPA